MEKKYLHIQLYVRIWKNLQIFKECDSKKTQRYSMELSLKWQIVLEARTEMSQL